MTYRVLHQVHFGHNNFWRFVSNWLESDDVSFNRHKWDMTKVPQTAGNMTLALLWKKCMEQRSSSLRKPSTVLSKFSLNGVFCGFWPKLLVVHYGHLKAIIFRLGEEFAYNTRMGWVISTRRHEEDKIPMWVVKEGAWKEFEYSLVHLTAQFIGNLHQFYANSQLFTLTKIFPDRINVPSRAEFQGFMSRVRVTLMRWASKT